MNIDKMMITQKLTNEKSNIEFDNVTARPIAGGTAQTKVPFIPIRDKVIIKAIFEESSMIVKSEDKIRRANPKHQIIIGIGDKVDGLNIGDEVKVGFNASIEPLEFENNDKSIKTMMDLIGDPKIKLNPIDAQQRKVIMIEYYIVPAISIVGIKI